jgi:hypothetical protein
MKNFSEVLEIAQQSKNESIKTFFDESDKIRLYWVAYNNTPEALYHSISFGRNKMHTRNGILFLNAENKLTFRKKYARSTKTVTNVTFDICGYKRKTTHLPAGVLVYNVHFFVNDEKIF